MSNESFIIDPKLAKKRQRWRDKEARKRKSGRYKEKDRVKKARKRKSGRYKEKDRVKKALKEKSGELKSKDADKKRRKRKDGRFKERDRLKKELKEKSGELKSKDADKKRRKRKDGRFKDKDKELSLKRKRDEEYKEMDRERHRELVSFDTLCERYNKNVLLGPTNVCFSCLGLWFGSSVTSFEVDGCVNQMFKEFVERNGNLEKILLCTTCLRDVKIGKIPRLCVLNGLDFPEIPEVLRGLSELESRLLSPRIPFMQIRPLGVDRQFGLSGNVVNVPISVETSVSILPRTFNETHTIQLALKRMMRHKSSYIFETIRPARVIDAVRYLIKQELYVQEEISISESWIQQYNNDAQDFVIDENDTTIDINISCPKDDWDETAEDNEPLNPTNNETLWEAQTINVAKAYAPGENKSPISLLNDKFVEELSFPTIFCGRMRKVDPNVKLSYADIIKSEIRNKDRRSCSIPALFFKLKKSQNIKMAKAINLCLRKKTNIGEINAGQLLNSQFVDNLIQHDDGYRFLKGDRATPSFWEEKKRELLAMIRQLGIPTIFLTLSAAESRWNELLIILTKILRNKDINWEEADKLSFMERCELIRGDPVSCARYFDYRIRELFKVLKAQNGPFGEHSIEDFYIRTEFQHRGSPHVHCLLWLKDAPKYIAGNDESIKQCIKFIDRFITCASSEMADDPCLGDIIKYQYHKHSKTCAKFKGGKKVCRFGIPNFPMPETIILEPFGQEVSETEMENNKKIYSKIETELIELSKISNQNSTETDFNLKFTEILEYLNITYDQYIMAIRSNIKRSTVYLKRDLKDMRINGFNKDIIGLHRANMDIQFVLDPYACVIYILNYINKSQRGMSNLLRQAAEEIDAGNMTIRKKLTRIGNKYLNSTEISAQEAVYHHLGMPMSKGSRGHIFINTGEPDKRVHLIKSEQQLKEMEESSTDIVVTGLLDHYSQRPDSLNELCLAAFAANYNFYKNRPNRNTRMESVDEENEDELKDSRETCLMYKLKDNSGYIEQRKCSKIIRYRRYSHKLDEINYYREQVMLFVPWRDEHKELINVDIKLIFAFYFEQINEVSKQFVFDSSIDIEEIHRDLDLEDQEEEVLHEKEQHDLEIYNTGSSIGDIEMEMGMAHPKPISESFLAPKCVSEDNYVQIIETLNSSQRRYIYELMHQVKAGCRPIHQLVFGGAGTGKSLLIKAINQSLLKYYNSRPGCNPDDVKVLLCSATGKASFNIGGMTLHAAFSLPVNQNRFQMRKLNSDTRNTIRCKLHKLEFLIIDEISMIGADMLDKVNQRLQDIFGNDEIYGNISILFFGDFNQLKPVADRFVFQNNKYNCYGKMFDALLWQQVRAFELTEIMRQQNDKMFANALNHLAVGQLNEEDISLFRSREIRSLTSVVPVEAIRIFRTNAEVNKYNELALRKLENEGCISTAKDIAFGDVSQKRKENAISAVRNLPNTSTYGLPTNLLLKEGGKYMVTVNINVSDGLVNGANGILRQIEYSIKPNGEKIPEKLWMEFKEQSVGVKARSQYARIMQLKKISTKLTPIEKTLRVIQPTKSCTVRVSRTQFPVVPSEAMTITKSQGQSFDEIVVGFERRVSRSELYVALSRARTANGLYIDGLFKVPESTNIDREVAVEIERLRTDAALKFNLRFLADLEDSADIKFMFHNVQSLVKYQQCVAKDENFMAADIIIMAELWTIPSDNIEFLGFSCVRRMDCEMRKPYGIAIYRREIKVELIDVSSTEHRSSHIEMMAVLVENNYGIIGVYNSPKSSLNILKHDLQRMINKLSKHSNKIIIVGDFNYNIKADESLIKSLYSLGFVLKIEKGLDSTDGQTQLDLVFANFDIDKAYYYESLTSYHKPLWFTI